MQICTSRKKHNYKVMIIYCDINKKITDWEEHTFCKTLLKKKGKSLISKRSSSEKEWEYNGMACDNCGAIFSKKSESVRIPKIFILVRSYK